MAAVEEDVLLVHKVRRMHLSNNSHSNSIPTTWKEVFKQSKCFYQKWYVAHLNSVYW